LRHCFAVSSRKNQEISENFGGVAVSNLPSWLDKKYTVVIILFFIGIFILSLDFWNWGQATPLISGLPYWVIYLFILTILTSLCFLLVSKYLWSDD
jgi:hypothetical protein